MSTIKVDQIVSKTTGGAVLMPNKPMIYATMNTITAANNIVKFDNIKINVGNCYSASTGRFTSTIAGYYWFAFNVMSDHDGTDAYGEIRVRKNGTSYSVSSFRTELDNDFNGLATGIVHLPVGEYIDCYTAVTKAYGNSGDANLDCLTHASVFLIG